MSAAVRFLSCEPLIGPLDGLDLDGIHWVIAGGESGANHRPVDGEWVRGIRDACQDAGVAFFLHQGAHLIGDIVEAGMSGPAGPGFI